MELRGALFQEGGRALVLVFRRGAEAEVGSLEQQAFTLAGLHALVGRFEREPDCDGSVGGDSFQDGFCACEEVSRGNDLVDKPDAIGLLQR